MREAHPTERAVGIHRYVSAAPGTGGRIRERPADFRVREIETIDPEPLDADPGAYPCVVVRATLSAWDTNDFAARLSDALGASRERVAWAGTKDKRAVTTQLFSVRGLDAEGVDRLRAVDVDGAEIEVLGRLGRDLGFGDLAGNEFEIVVAAPDRPDAVDAVVADLRAFARGEYDPPDDARPSTDGSIAVPNFFGQQRFGSRRPVTHRVGLHAVRGDWRAAVLAYVGNPSDAEPASTRAARERVEREAERESPDWAGILEEFPRRLGYERSMLHRLAETEPAPDDDAGWRAALEAVPSSLRRLFVNAAQSYAFNEILSRRLERRLPFDRPVAGDVVAFADDDLPAGAPPAPDPDRTQRASSDRVDVLARHCERGRAFVTAPLVGTDTDLGGGDPGAIERAVLDDIGVAPGDFDLPEGWASAGTRRSILLPTTPTIERDPLTLSFALPSGAYATVVLRELLKTAPDSLS